MNHEQRISNKTFDIIAIAFGICGMICCLISLGLSVTDSIYSKYTLVMAIIFVGLSKTFLLIYNKHIDNFIFEAISAGSMLLLAIFVGLSSINIYFLIVSFFVYSLLICFNKVLVIQKDHSIQSVIHNSLVITFCFLYSFIFFFPAIYEKHATSVTNWNFIVLSYTMIVLFTAFRTALVPIQKKLRLDHIAQIIRKTMAEEIILLLLVLVTIFSIYFTLVEPNMVSFVDSLWYSFSVITTIGFGDVTVTTTLGRILSVILGMYGIIVFRFLLFLQSYLEAFLLSYGLDRYTSSR